jgi:hypothetical protein
MSAFLTVHAMMTAVHLQPQRGFKQRAVPIKKRSAAVKQSDTVAALIIEPRGGFFCGEKTKELLRLLPSFPHKKLNQVLQ